MPAASGGPQCGVEPLPAGLSSRWDERSGGRGKGPRGGGNFAGLRSKRQPVGNESARRGEVGGVTPLLVAQADLTTAVPPLKRRDPPRCAQILVCWGVEVVASRRQVTRLPLRKCAFYSWHRPAPWSCPGLRRSQATGH